MTDTSMTTSQFVTAFFDDRTEAETAVGRIVTEGGVPLEEIQIVAGNDPSDDATSTAPREDRGFLSSLSNMFIPEEDRHTYAEGLKRGGFIVSLYTTAENRERILDILEEAGTVDMDAREESWRAEGWTGYEAAPALAAGSLEPGASQRVDGTIDVVEENLRVGKRQVEQGRVRVRSYVVETPVEEQVSVRDETVRVTRTPVDRPVTGDMTFTDRTLEATETDEEAVVSKEARVTEEITLDKDVEERTETVRDTVRRTEVEVEDDRLDRKK